MEIANSNEIFLGKVRDTIGKGSVGFIGEKNPLWKDKWQYNGARSVLRGILPQILPHLLIKHEIAERMLDYLRFVDSNPIDGLMQIPRGYYEKLDLLYWAVKELNRKNGDPKSLILPLKSWNLNGRGPGSRVTNCRQMTESERAWLAGVIDGEGSIFLSKVIGPNYRRGFFYRPQLEVSNSNRQFLIRVAEIIGEGTVHLSKRGNGVQKTRWAYCAASGVLRVVLPQIIPYMIVKWRIAEKMLEFFAFIDDNSIIKSEVLPSYEKLDSIYWTIKKLNKKGKTRRATNLIMR